jgi:hypothetical protein
MHHQLQVDEAESKSQAALDFVRQRKTEALLCREHKTMSKHGKVNPNYGRKNK